MWNVHLSPQCIRININAVNNLQTGDHPSPTKLIERKAVCLEKLGRYDEAAAELQTVADELGTDEKSSEKVSELEQKIRKLRSGEGSGEIRNGLVDPEQGPML